MNIEVHKTNILVNLLKASRRTAVLTDSSWQSSVAGAMYGAKCGISDPENLPTRLHYALATLHHQGLVHAWIQNGHDGLPQKAGFRAEDVTEVYNMWFDQQETGVEFLQDELGKVDFEGEMVDLLLIFGDVTPGITSSKMIAMPLGIIPTILKKSIYKLKSDSDT